MEAKPPAEKKEPQVDIFKDFKEHSIAEFFKKNRQMLGYSGKIKSLTTVVHELVTNSLDACEEAGISPEIFVQLTKMGNEHYQVAVEDNGPGIPKKLLGKALGKMLAGTKFHRFQQARGQQGIGASGCIMYSQITTGKPTKIVSSQKGGILYECYLTIDTKTNEPHISSEKEYTGSMKGTRIEMELKDVMYQKSEYGPDEYVRRTALANPHAKFTYIDPDGLTYNYDRAVSKVPPIPKPTKPHPKGVTVDDMLSYAGKTTARTIKSFLVSEFARLSSEKASEMEKLVTFDMNKRPRDMTWEEAEQVVKAIQQTNFIAPPADCLIPISEDHLDKAMGSVLQPEFKIVLTRPPAVYRGGVPFIVEVALAYGGKAGRVPNGTPESQQDRMEIMRFANRVPLLFDAGGCAITKAVQSVEWKRYDIREDVPVTVLVNFTSIYVPYTGAGKQAVSDEEDIIKEIRLALMDTGRRLGSYVSGQRRKYEREEKKKTLMLYIEPIAEAVANLTEKDQKKIYAKLKDLVERKYGEIEENGGEEEGNAGEAEEPGDEDTQ
jgi:DNA topoisomerase-6 subunit B